MKKIERNRKILKIFILGVVCLMLLSIIPSSGSAYENVTAGYAKAAKSPDVANVRIVYDTSYKTADYTCWTPGIPSYSKWNGTEYNDLNTVKNAGVVRRNTTFTVTGTGAGVSTNITIKGPTDSGYRPTIDNVAWDVTYWEGEKWNLTIPEDAPVGDYQIYMDDEYCTLYVIFNVSETKESSGMTDNQFACWGYDEDNAEEPDNYVIIQSVAAGLVGTTHSFDERLTEIVCSVMGGNTTTPYQAAINLYRLVNARIKWVGEVDDAQDAEFLLNDGTGITAFWAKKVALQTGISLPDEMINSAGCQCTHFGTLTCSVARSIGIPSRCAMDDHNIGELYGDYWSYHSFAELYIQNAGSEITLSSTDSNWTVFDTSDQWTDTTQNSNGASSIGSTHQYGFHADRLDKAQTTETIGVWEWKGPGNDPSVLASWQMDSVTNNYSYRIADIPTVNIGDYVEGDLGEGDRDFFRISVTGETSVDLGFVEGAEYAQIYVNSTTTGTNVPGFSPSGADLKTDYYASLLWGDDKKTDISIGGGVDYLYVMVDNAKGEKYADDYWTGGRSEVRHYKIGVEPVPPNVAVFSPNGGETLVANGFYTITWNATDIKDLPINTVNISYSVDGGATYPYTIVTNTENDEAYTWNVPDLNIDTVRINVTITDSDNLLTCDTSDTDFSIKPSVPLNEMTNGIGAVSNDKFGWNVSGAGDVNGDNINDIIVGAPFAAAGGIERGAVYIFFGYSSIDLSNINAANANVTINGITNGGHLGWSVSNAGDVNGNGKDDVIIGAPNTTNGNAYIFYGETIFGGGTWTVSSADVAITGGGSGNRFGCSVASAGNVNGADNDDIIVGAYLNDAGGIDAGRTYIFYGDAGLTGTLAVADADVNLTGSEGSWFGFSVSSAGDTNSDGYDDVIIGAPGSSNGNAYILYGGSDLGAPPPPTILSENFDASTTNGSIPPSPWSREIGAGGSAVNWGNDYGNNYLTPHSGANYQWCAGQTLDAKSYYYSNSMNAWLKYGPFSLVGYSSATLSFWTQIRTATGDNSYWLASPDGTNWGTDANPYGGTQVASDTAWRQITLDLGNVPNYGSLLGDDSVWIAFWFTSDTTSSSKDGYFIDDVTISGTPISGFASPDITLTGEKTGDKFGYSVSGAGDLNNDSASDVVIGAPGYENNRGRAYIMFGDAGLSIVNDTYAEFTASGNQLNNVYATAGGDVNLTATGSGVDTIVVEGFLATNGGTTASASLVLNKPSGVTVGELLLLIVGNSDSTATAQFSNNLGGWNFIGNGGGSTADAHIGAFWRIADGTEDATVTVTAQSSDYWWGWYIRISGANTTNPIHVSNFVQGVASASSFAIPQVTTTVDNCLAIYGLSFDGADGYPFSVSGTGWSESAEQRAGTTGTYGSGCWGTKQQATAGGTGTATVTCTVADGASYFQLAIQPGTTTTYATSGNLTSVTTTTSFDIGEVTAVIDADIPSKTNLVIKVSRDGGNTWSPSVGGLISGEPYKFIEGEPNGNKLSYKAIFSTTDTSKTPILHKITLYYSTCANDISLTGECTGDQFGYSVSGAGDVNNDGYDDLIVGAPFYGASNGSIYVFNGSSVMDIGIDYNITGENANDNFGFSVCSLGDVNNDNYDDVIVGAPNTANGKAYVYTTQGGAPPEPDTEKPQISGVNDSPDPQETGGYVNITAVVTDNVGVSDVKVNISGPAGFTPVNISMTKVSFTDTYYYNISYSILGTYTYFIWATDTGSNENTSTSYTFIIQDTTKPEITNVQDTPDPQEVNGWVNITVTVTDAMLDTVKVNISGPTGFTPVNTTMTKISGTDNYYYNTTYLVKGTYSYFIWANDSSNNENTSATYYFEIDNTPPDISNINDNPDPQEVGGYVNITVTVTDNIGVDSVFVNITDPNGDSVNVSMINIGGTDDYYYNNTYSILGDYGYFVWANDTSNNGNKSGSNPFTMQDTTKPGISSVQANPEEQTSGDYVNISAVVTDPYLNEVYLNITYPDNSYENISITLNKTVNTYYCNKTYTILGWYNYTIWANDTSDNWNSSDVYSFNITGGNQPPNIPSILGVEGFISGAELMNITDHTPNLNWTYSDPDGDPQGGYNVTVWNGTTIMWYINSTGTDNNVTYGVGGSTPQPLADGFDYNFTVKVNDSNGAWSILSYLIFHMNTPPPAPTIPVTPSNGETGVSTNTAISWTNLSDNEGSQITYYWYVDVDNPPAFPYNASGSTISNTSGPLSLDPGITYYWRVMANDSYENATDWSSTWSFTTSSENNPPNPPSLTGPENNTWTNDNTPYFDWDFLDPDGGDSQGGFHVQVNSTLDWAAPDYDYNSSTNASTFWDFPAGTGYTTIPDGTWYWRVKTKDNNGAWGGWSGWNVTKIDTTPPTLNSIIISDTDTGNTTWTNSLTVTLWVSATDTYSGMGTGGGMCFKNEAGGTWSAWETYSTIKIWTLQSGADGTRTVYFKAKDAAGNENTIGISDTIILDTTAPTATIEYNNANTYYKDSDVIRIYANFTETGSGINETTVKISINYTDGTDLIPTLMTKTDNTHWYYDLNIPTGSTYDGKFTVNITAKDNATNTLNPDPTQDSSKYIDNTAPTISSTAPADGGITPNVWQNISFSFSEAMNTTTVIYTVENSTAWTNTSIPEWSGDKTTLWLNHTTPFNNFTTYWINITAGKDPAGNDVTGTKRYLDFYVDTSASDTTEPDSSVNILPWYWNTTGTAVITATATDASGVQCVSLWYSYSSENISWSAMTYVDLMTFVGGNTWEYTFTFFAVGWYNLSTNATDSSSNHNEETVNYAGDVKCGYDPAPPFNPSTNTSDPTVNTWSNDTTVYVEWSDASDDLSGIAVYYYAWTTTSAYTPTELDNSTELTSNTSLPLSDNANWYLHIITKDNASNLNLAAYHVGPFKIDSTPPSNPNSNTSSSHTVGVWSSNNIVQVTWDGADGSISGINKSYYCWDTDPETNPTDSDNSTTGTSNTSLALGDNAGWYLHVRVVDNAMNLAGGAYHIGPFRIDTKPPVTNLETSPSSPNGLNGWYNSSVTVYLNATDLAGVSKIYYRINGGWLNQWVEANENTSFTLAEDKADNYTIEYYAVDILGQKESEKENNTIKIDKTGPVIAHNPLEDPQRNGPYNVTATITDIVSGVNETTVYLYYNNSTGYVDKQMENNGNVFWCLIPNQTDNTNISYYIQANDTAGNSKTTDECTFRVDLSPITENDIRFSHYFGMVGQNITIYVDVYNNGSNGDIGYTVEFYNGNPSSFYTIWSFFVEANKTITASAIYTIGSEEDINFRVRVVNITLGIDDDVTKTFEVATKFTGAKPVSSFDPSLSMLFLAAVFAALLSLKGKRKRRKQL